MILVEADVSGEWDSSTDWAALAHAAVRAAVEASGNASLLEQELTLEVSVKFAGDDEVRALNAAWRGKDKATNVLSFPMVEPGSIRSLPGAAPGEILLGDVILARGICLREAEEKGIPFSDHAAHLVVHGTLHLLGYDHQEGGEAEAMEGIERRALAGLGVADPYMEVQS